jgi:hypothetical protein
VHLLDVTILAQLAGGVSKYSVFLLACLHEKVLVETVKVSLELLLVQQNALGGVCRVVVDIGEENGLGEGRLDMFTARCVSN